MTEHNGTPEQTPPGVPAEQPQPPAYGLPQYPQPPYPQPQYGQPQYGQPQYGQPQTFPGYAPPTHPKATTALVLGLVSVAGGFMCFLPILLSPFAWVTGHNARKEIRAANGQLDGASTATAGMVLGIIGTVLLALIFIVIAVFVIVAVNDPTAFDDSSLA